MHQSYLFPTALAIIFRLHPSVPNKVSDSMPYSTQEPILRSPENSLFNLQETITLYDLTNTYFEGQSTANAYTALGHSKEKRSDCPLVTLGLVLDSSGFPRRSKVYAGNVSEPTTLAEMLEDLEGDRVSTGVKPCGHGCRHCN
ncbi:MAG: hypothetical protein V2B20_25330 [Pseudomonadota bacterium]